MKDIVELFNYEDERGRDEHVDVQCGVQRGRGEARHAVSKLSLSPAVAVMAVVGGGGEGNISSRQARKAAHSAPQRRAVRLPLFLSMEAPRIPFLKNDCNYLSVDADGRWMASRECVASFNGRRFLAQDINILIFVYVLCSADHV